MQKSRDRRRPPPQRVAEEAQADDEVEAKDKKADGYEDQAPIRIQKTPGVPTAAEVAAHKITHLPHRDWCPICVQARSREDKHFRKKNKDKEEQLGMPEIGMDYKSVGKGRAKIIIIRDKLSRTTFAHVVECKGPGDDWAIRQVEEDIRETGRTDIELKGDGEPSLLQFQD